MPRGRHPNSLNNLKSGSDFFGKHKENARKAAKKSNEVQAQNKEQKRIMKTFAELANEYGSLQSNEEIAKTFSKLFNIPMETITNDGAVMLRQYEKAIKKGDTKAAEYITYTKDGKPTQTLKYQELPEYKATDEDIDMFEEEIAKRVEQEKRKWMEQEIKW